MSDPQDLLYTNNYLSKQLITNENLLNETEYYDRYTDFLNKNREPNIQKYIEDDLNEESEINLNKTLNTKWPVDYKKNHYPSFDPFINDVSSNRYKKEIITKVSINSNDRDTSKYYNPNSFTISFQKVFNNLKKVVINDLNFQNINRSITGYNNNLAWQYITKNFLITNNINKTIIPTPGNIKIYYSDIPNSVYSYKSTYDEVVENIDNYLLYQTSIPPAFYDIDSIIESIRASTSLIYHGQNAIQNNNTVIEQPYLSSPAKIGNPHLFSCSIDPITSIVRFVNRVEEINIVAIQTFAPYENNFTNTDIFYYYSSLYSSTNPVYTLNSRYIYVSVIASSDTSYQYYNNLYNLNLANPFPLVITNLKTNVGDINSELFNYTPFFDLNIYLTNGYNENDLNSVSYYKYIDTITISNTTTINGNSVTITNKYLRFALSLSTGNINGNIYNSNGNRIIPVTTSNLIFLDSLNSFYENLNIYYNYSFIKIQPIIGRSLLFRWIYDKINNNYINYEIETLNQKKRTLLHILGWPIANETNQIYVVQINDGYNFVQTNYNINYTAKKNLVSFEFKENYFPEIKLNLQNMGNKYYFVNNSYIYLKLYFNDVDSINSDNKTSNFIVGISNQNILYNQIYVMPQVFNVGIGEDYTYIKNCASLEVFKKNNYDFFAKILLSNEPGNYSILNSNIINNNSYLINYDNVLNNINGVNIALYDNNFRLLESSNEFSFTLNIHEIKDVLKETLINTKTNNVTSTGNFI